MKSKQPVISDHQADHSADHRSGPRAHKVVTIALLVALLTGLIPPPLAHSILPPAAAALVEAALPQPAVAQAAGTITGTVFQDYNSNGVMNTAGDTANPAIDVGVAGVTVTAYDSTGTNVGSTTTRDGAGNPSAGAIGTYSLSAGGTGPYRIEFTSLPSGYYPTTHGSDSGSSTAHTGTNSGTTVQFVPDGATANVNLGINRPNDYCQNNPWLCSNTMWFGNQITGTFSSQPALGLFRYTASGKAPAPTKLATAANVGATWGLAWQRSNKTVYTAAFLKRHTGFGPNGPGAIYKTSVGADGVIGTTDDVTSLFVDLATLSGVSVGANPHPVPDATTNCFNGNASLTTGTNDWCFDINTYPLVGKSALGDIDISDDESTLYVMNLFDRRMYIIPITNPSGFTSVAMPDPGTGATGCPLDATTPAGQLNLNVRPFALKYYNSKVYVGEVCTAQSTQNAADMRMFVYEYTGSTFTQVLNAPLTFARGTQGDGLNEQWHPWIDSTWPAHLAGVMGANGELFVGYSQPWLTDIEFDRGTMLLGMRDRFGDQSGNIAGSIYLTDTQGYTGIGNGDIYRACPSGATWVLESNGTCGGVTSLSTGANGGGNGGPGNGQGPGGGEFYYQDNAGDDHLNLGLGGLVQLPAFIDVVSTAVDPVVAPTNGDSPQTDLYQSGVTWNNNTTGAKTKGYTAALHVDGSFAKAGSMGDVEALCDAAPLEIGNRVWRDSGNDGIQDPNEPPLANVVVELYQGGVKVGEATTDAYGEYYFGGPHHTNMLVSPTLTTITATVTASSDDAAQTVSSGAVNINNGALNLPYNGTALNLIGLRFANLTIPYNTTINSANIRFTANGNASTTVNLTIRGEAADNGATFAAITNNLSSRTTTSASVNWSPGAWTGGATTNATTPDLAALVQEVVDRTGWSSGNSLAFVISDNGTPSSSNRRVARSFDNSNGGAPLLTVSYYAPYSVQANTAYEIRIPNASGGSQQTPLGGLSLTTQNAGGVSSNDPVLDMRDSDGTTSGVNAVINYTTSSAGVNNHTLDFGFGTPAVGTIQLVKNATGGNGTFDFSSLDSALAAVSLTTVGGTASSAVITKTAGVYTITEDALSGWTLSDITFSGDSDSGSTKSVGSRQAQIDLDAGEKIIVTFANSKVVTPGGFVVYKQIGATDGSSPTVNSNFTIAINCAGVAGYPRSQSVNVNTPIAVSNLVSGTVCSFSEDLLTLPAAPSGYTWVNSQVSPSSITIQSNMTATVTARNTLAPLPTAATNVLTITKTISGTGSGPFNLTIAGPSGYVTNTTINGGETKVITGLASGVYTVTESTPVGWTTVYTVGTVNSSVNALVNLTNGNNVTPINLGGNVISGLVYADYDSSGVRTSNELGVANVTVKAYNAAGLCATTATDATGAYSFTSATLTCTGPWRIEFSGIPSAYEPARAGTENGTTVQFVNTLPVTGGVNLAIAAPCDYCQPDPNLAVSIPRKYQSTGDATTALFARGDGSLATENRNDNVSYVNQTGQSVWGLGWQRNTKRLFVCAYLKRGIGYGPAGSGGIYVFDSTTDTQVGTITIPNAGATPRFVSAPTLSAGQDCTNVTAGIDWWYDSCSFAQVGRESLGDIEISEDGNSLWVVNLYNRHLYKVDITPGSTFPVTDLGLITAPACAGGSNDWRPFALKAHHNSLYVGGVCSGETNNTNPTMNTGTTPWSISDNIAQVSAHVLRVTNPSSSASATAVFAQTDMSFNRGKVTVDTGGTLYDLVDGRWHAWTTEFYDDVGYNPYDPASPNPLGNQPLRSFMDGWYYPQPILSDIEIDSDGSFILGFRDRWTDMTTGAPTGWGTARDPRPVDVDTDGLFHSYSGAISIGPVGCLVRVAARYWMVCVVIGCGKAAQAAPLPSATPAWRQTAVLRPQPNGIPVITPMILLPMVTWSSPMVVWPIPLSSRMWLLPRSIRNRGDLVKEGLIFIAMRMGRMLPFRGIASI